MFGAATGGEGVRCDDPHAQATAAAVAQHSGIGRRDALLMHRLGRIQQTIAHTQCRSQGRSRCPPGRSPDAGVLAGCRAQRMLLSEIDRCMSGNSPPRRRASRRRSHSQATESRSAFEASSDRSGGGRFLVALQVVAPLAQSGALPYTLLVHTQSAQVGFGSDESMARTKCRYR